MTDIDMTWETTEDGARLIQLMGHRSDVLFAVRTYDRPVDTQGRRIGDQGGGRSWSRSSPAARTRAGGAMS